MQRSMIPIFRANGSPHRVITYKGNHLREGEEEKQTGHFWLGPLRQSVYTYRLRAAERALTQIHEERLHVHIQTTYYCALRR